MSFNTNSAMPERAAGGSELQADQYTADGAQAPDPNHPPQGEPTPALPFWLEEKFFWKHSANGTAYLSPKEDAIADVVHFAGELLKDALNPESANYAFADDSTDAEFIETQVRTRAELLSDVRAYYDETSDDNRGEAAAELRWLANRFITAMNVAGGAQLEAFNWMQRHLARGKKAEELQEQQNFQTKLAVRDKWTRIAASYFLIAQGLGEKLGLVTPAELEKGIRSRFYDAASQETRKLRQPDSRTVEDGQQVAVSNEDVMLALVS